MVQNDSLAVILDQDILLSKVIYRMVPSVYHLCIKKCVWFRLDYFPKGDRGIAILFVFHAAVCLPEH